MRHAIRRPDTATLPRPSHDPLRLPAARRLPALALLPALLFAACGGETAPESPSSDAPALADDEVPRAQRMEAALRVLAGDEMEGRAAGTPGEVRARDWLVSELERLGVQPAGEQGYLQAVPLVRMTDDQGRERLRSPAVGTNLDSIPADQRVDAWNVLGLVPGSDPALAHEVIIVGSHYDHVGMGRAVDGDSIYNGADDDASGTVAALEIARDLVKERPGRSVLIALFSAEEIGLLGPRWFLRQPTVARDSIVADLQIEMIGRPDSLAGGPGQGWLTGYERSTMGEALAAAGSPIVPDPRPEQRFFFRSDNLPFAQAGIPAHTLSSYNMHTDYHQPSDEVDAMDFEHMAALTEAAIAMVRDLAQGERPAWLPGGQPEAPGGN